MIGQDTIIEGAPWMESADGVAVWQLACPECGETEIEADNGDHEATGHAGGDSPIGTDGGYTDFRLRCRAGHRFRLVVGAHKGAQFIGVVQAGAPAAESEIDVPGTVDPS